MPAEWTPWPSRVVAELAQLRENGVDGFDAAWASAMRAHPPGSINAGPARLTLFAVDADDESSVEEFLREQCRREWAGAETRDYRGALLIFAADAGAARKASAA